MELFKTETSKVKLYIDNKDISYITVNSRGRIVSTGEKIKVVKDGITTYEKGDTFNDTQMDLKSIKVGFQPSISFNKKIFTKLNYVITSIECQE